MPSSTTSPPESTRGPGQSASDNTESYYSQEDIEALRDIVIHAEELLPKLPERDRLPTTALFNAYFDIRDELGISPDLDSHYALFFFKLGGLRGQGSLFDKFRKVLSEMGIELEFEDEAVEDSGIIIEELQDELDTLAAEESSPHGAPRGRLRRRDSESSMWHGTQSKYPDRPRSISPDVMARAEIRTSQQNSWDENTRPFRDAFPDQQTGHRGQEDAQARIVLWQNRLNMGNEKPNSTNDILQHYNKPIANAHSDQEKGDNRSSELDGGHLVIESAGIVPEIEEDVVVGPQRDIQDPPIHPSTGSLMQIKATVILDQHLRYLAHRQIRQWRDNTRQLQEDNINLMTIAIYHDKLALLRPAFHNWREVRKKKRQEEETERFYAQLERRATRARDIFLLAKAFTHWAETAFERIEETSIARRHILRTRIFNAWREITAVNELKVRRFTTQKFFALWKAQNSLTTARNELAVQKYTANVTQTGFEYWHHRALEKQSISWRENLMKRQKFYQWDAELCHLHDMMWSAEEMHKSRLIGKAWQNWYLCKEKFRRRDEQAVTYHNTKLCRNAFTKLRHEFRIAPAKKAVNDDVTTRLLREKLRLWQRQAEAERKATDFYTTRALGNTITAWRHQARHKQFKDDADDKNMKKYFCLWLIQERSKRMQHINESKLLHGTLMSWVGFREENADTKYARETIAESFAEEMLKKRLLTRWANRIWEQRARENQAMEHHILYSLQQPLNVWSRRARHIIFDNTRAARGQWFGHMAPKLRLWVIASQTRKREKYRTIYGQIRRTAKIKMAKNALGEWHTKTAQILEKSSHAVEIARSKDLVRSMYYFDQWRAQTEEVLELEALWQARLLGKCFTTLKLRLSSLHEMNRDAGLHYEERQENRMVKKWSLQTLKQRAQSHYASEVLEKNAKRNFRRKFTSWQQQAVQRRNLGKGTTSQDPRLSQSRFQRTVRTETWSESGDLQRPIDWTRDLDLNNLTTPVPAYLVTPSRRAVRASTASRLTSTTPKVPLSTPFERRLRAQYSGLDSSRRKGRALQRVFGKADEGFADITERSDMNNE